MMCLFSDTESKPQMEPVPKENVPVNGRGDDSTLNNN